MKALGYHSILNTILLLDLTTSNHSLLFNVYPASAPLPTAGRTRSPFYCTPTTFSTSPRATTTTTITTTSSNISIPTFAYASQSRSKSSLIPRRAMMEVSFPTFVTIPPITTIAGVATVFGILYSLLVLSESGSSPQRQKQKQYAEYEAQMKVIQEEKAKKAFIEPKDFWKEEELKQYDGTLDPEGPILVAVNGKVFNVYKGRHFYGPGCEYHIFAGRDATRLLAKGKLEEETQEEKGRDLTMAERATLQGWLWTFESKYDVVGKLEGFVATSTSTRTKTGT